MKHLLYYIVAILFVIGWAIGFFVSHVGSTIHILLFIAALSVLYPLSETIAEAQMS